MMTVPYHHVNVLTGFRSARIIEDVSEYADYIKRANRPLLVVGPRTLVTLLDGKPVIEYVPKLISTLNIPVCATAHTKKKLLELGVKPDSTLDIIEIINQLKYKDWKGVRKEGNHGLVIIFGIRTDLGEQGLSTLKHFATHLKTMTLCKYYFPNADYSLPNLSDEKWKEFLDNLVIKLSEKEA